MDAIRPLPDLFQDVRLSPARTDVVGRIINAATAQGSSPTQGGIVSTDTRPEVIPGPRPTVSVDASCSGPVVSVEMTAAARDDTEGETLRRELAQGICQTTWRNYPHTHLRDDPTIYTQHRCGRDLQHRGACRCRYCGRDKASA